MCTPVRRPVRHVPGGGGSEQQQQRRRLWFYQWLMHAAGCRYSRNCVRGVYRWNAGLLDSRLAESAVKIHSAELFFTACLFPLWMARYTPCSIFSPEFSQLTTPFSSPTWVFFFAAAPGDSLALPLSCNVENRLRWKEADSANEKVCSSVTALN